MNGIFFGVLSAETLKAMDDATNQWERDAAKGLCVWICASCCTSFPNGMPTSCPHGAAGCTEIMESFER